MSNRRLRRDARIPDGAKVELHVTVAYTVPIGRPSLVEPEMLCTVENLEKWLNIEPGYAIPVARREGWDGGEEIEAVWYVNDVQVEQGWEQDSREKGGWLPSGRKYVDGP